MGPILPMITCLAGGGGEILKGASVYFFLVIICGGFESMPGPFLVLFLAQNFCRGKGFGGGFFLFNLGSLGKN